MPSPPSTGSTAPVMYPAASEARNLTVAATSSSSPKRPSGTCVEHGGPLLVGEGVDHVGGQRARAPPRSRRRCGWRAPGRATSPGRRGRPSTRRSWPVRPGRSGPTTDEMKMMRPNRARIIFCAARFATRNAAGEVGVDDGGEVVVGHAQHERCRGSCRRWTRATSTGPSASSTSPNAASTESGSVTSQRTQVIGARRGGRCGTCRRPGSRPGRGRGRCQAEARSPR